MEHYHIDEGHVHSFGIGRNVMRLASRIAKTEEKMPRLLLEDNNTAFVIDGHYVGLETLRKWIKDEIAELDRILYGNLFFGHIFSTSRKAEMATVPNLHDDYTNIAPGYSFLSDERNCPETQHLLLIEHVMTDPKLHERFCATVNGTVRWKRGAVLMYLTDCKDAWCRLAVIMQITGGLDQPASELAATSTHNTIHGMRSIYVLHQEFATLGLFSRKDQNQLCNDFLVRFYTQEISDIALDMSIFLRPFESVLSHEVYDDEKTRCYQQYLFVGMGKRLDVDQISECFARHSSQALGHRISFKLWTLISDFLRQKFCPVLRWLRSCSQDIGIQQGGHGAQAIALYYGREVEKMQNLTDSMIDVCRYFSREWQYFLRIGPSNSSGPPSALHYFLGEDTFRALASLAPGVEEMKHDIESLHMRTTSIKSQLQANLTTQAELTAKINSLRQERVSSPCVTYDEQAPDSAVPS